MTCISLWIPYLVVRIEVASYYDYAVVVYIDILLEIFVELKDYAFVAWIVDIDN